MKLREQIRSSGLKLSWIAGKINVSPPLLSMYLSGERNMPEEKEKQIKQLIK